MKLTLTSKPLLDALALCQKIASPKANMPWLSCTLLVWHEGTLTVIADSVEQRLSITIPNVEHGDDGSILVPMKQLAASLRGDTADLVFKEGSLTVSSGGKSKIGTLTADNFPQDWHKVARRGQDAKAFISGLKNTVAFCHPGGANYALECIQFDPGKSRVVATTGRIISLAPVELLLVEEKFLLHSTLARGVLAVFDPEDEIQLGVSDSIMAVSTESTLLLSKLAEANYPDYQQIIPQPLKTCAVSSYALVKAIQSLEGFADQVGGVNVTPKKGKWTLQSSDGTHESSTDIDVDGEVLPAFRMVGSMLANLVKGWGADTVSISNGGVNDNDCLLVHPDGDKEHFGVIMLMRVA